MPETTVPGGTSYRDAGVDRARAQHAKGRILELVESSLTPGVVRNPGGFGGLLRVPRDFSDGLLVSSADGVGTKLKVAMRAGRHDTVGHDLVNHCVNDILVEGAHPLFFLDYIGMGRLESHVVEALVTGMVAGCRENDCALLGGETAEMPDFYAPGEYDLAGFIVGLTREQQRPGAHRVGRGDVLLGLAANGFHTNGYTLLRRVLFDRMKLDVHDAYPGTGRPVADELLRVHRSYLHAVLPLVRDGSAHALAHITGGGIAENLERVIPAGLRARVDTSTWPIPRACIAIMEAGPVARPEMFATFNMGIGMIVVVGADQASTISGRLEQAGQEVVPMGEVEAGEPRVVLA
ncbi:MAG: phosphoribosylformylglycinamidine cyclo-ligase [Longimicrobiales bacterium]